MTTKFDKIFVEIESDQFSAQLGLASGFKMFHNIMKNNETFNLLCLIISNNGCEVVIDRIKEIIKTDFDHKYENPYDTALATYILALLKINRQAGIYASQLVYDEHQTWWTNQVIQRLYDSTSSNGL